MLLLFFLQKRPSTLFLQPPKREEERGTTGWSRRRLHWLIDLSPKETERQRGRVGQRLEQGIHRDPKRERNTESFAYFMISVHCNKQNNNNSGSSKQSSLERQKQNKTSFYLFLHFFFGFLNTNVGQVSLCVEQITWGCWKFCAIRIDYLIDAFH